MTHEYCLFVEHLRHGNRMADIIARYKFYIVVSCCLGILVKRGGLLSCCRRLHMCCSQCCTAARRATRRSASPLLRLPWAASARLAVHWLGLSLRSAAAGPRTARSQSRGAARMRAAARRGTKSAARAWALASRRAWSPTDASLSWSSATQVCALLWSEAHFV